MRRREVEAQQMEERLEGYQFFFSGSASDPLSLIAAEAVLVWER